MSVWWCSPLSQQCASNAIVCRVCRVWNRSEGVISLPRQTPPPRTP